MGTESTGVGTLDTDSNLIGSKIYQITKQLSKMFEMIDFINFPALGNAPKIKQDSNPRYIVKGIIVQKTGFLIIVPAAAAISTGPAT